MDRALKTRVLTASDIMAAHTAITEELTRQAANCFDEKTARFIGGQIVGIEKFTMKLLDMLAESGYRCSNCGFESDDYIGCCPRCGVRAE